MPCPLHKPARRDPYDPRGERFTADEVEGNTASSAGERFTAEEIDSITILRDSKMSVTEAGRRWIKLFEKHSAEVVRIFENDSATMRQVDLSIRECIPLIKALVGIDKTPHMIEAKHVALVEESVTALRSRASPELRKDLDEVEKEVGLGSFRGIDIRSAWNALVVATGIDKTP